MDSTATTPTDRSGYVPPVPIDLPVIGPGRRAARIAQAIASATRHLGGVLAVRALRRRPDTVAVARGLRRTFEELGGTYLKLGQLIASAPGVFGDDESAEFRGCLDRGPAVAFDRVRATVETGIGAPVDAVFDSLDAEPVAAASIAVVHKGVLRSGAHVAVKVLRPGIEELVAADLESMRPLFGFLSRQGLPAAAALNQLLFGFREQLAEELDLTNEARAMTHFRRIFAEVGLRRIAIPDVVEDLTSRRVLTMEYLDGVAIDDPERLGELAPEPGPLLEELVRAWLLTALRDGIFHADVHAGNLMLLRDGRLGLIDWGIVGRLDDKTYRFFRRLIEGSLGDDAAWDDVVVYLSEIIESAGGRLALDHTERAQLVKAMVQPLLTQPFGAVGITSLFMTRERAAEIIGRPLPARPRRTRLERFRRRREFGSRLDSSIGTETFRSNFLLTKQLLYVEGYAKRYLADAAILSDREFLRRVLQPSPGP